MNLKTSLDKDMEADSELCHGVKRNHANDPPNSKIDCSLEMLRPVGTIIRSVHLLMKLFIVISAPLGSMQAARLQ